MEDCQHVTKAFTLDAAIRLFGSDIPYHYKHNPDSPNLEHDFHIVPGSQLTLDDYPILHGLLVCSYVVDFPWHGIHKRIRLLPQHTVELMTLTKDARLVQTWWTQTKRIRLHAPLILRHRLWNVDVFLHWMIHEFAELRKIIRMAGIGQTHLFYELIVFPPRDMSSLQLKAMHEWLVLQTSSPFTPVEMP